MLIPPILYLLCHIHAANSIPETAPIYINNNFSTLQTPAEQTCRFPGYEIFKKARKLRTAGSQIQKTRLSAVSIPINVRILDELKRFENGSEYTGFFIMEVTRTT
jgi:hypothetical protein